MRILIVDDEVIIRKGIRSLLESFDVELTIVGECGSVAEAVILAKNCRPDVVLLDINLPDGDAFDFLEKIGQSDFHLVFITAYEEYAIRAIKYGAMDYLLKPIDEDEFTELIEKLSHISAANTGERINVVQKQLEGDNSKIVLRLFDSYQVVKYADLMYCKSDGGYTTFFLKNCKQYTASRSLKEFEKLLPEKKFFRTHQSYLANLEMVDKYDRDGVLHLNSGSEVPVSMRKKEALLKRLF